MQKTVSLITILIVSLAMLFSSGCAAARKPVMVDADFLQNQPETVSVLPPIDARRDKEKIKFKKLEKQILRCTKNHLKYRKYKTVILENYAVNHSPEYLAEIREDELVSLAPKNIDIAFVYILDDLVDNNNVISHTAQITARAYLIDPAKQKIIWKDEFTSNPGGAGLAHAFVNLKDVCIIGSLEQMIKSIPKRGTRPKSN